MASDLHTHTNFSDGIYSPEKLVETAKNLGMKILAITDHDTVDGVASLKDIDGIHIIPGVEITAQHPNSRDQLHIIGLNVDINNQGFKNYLDELAGKRRKRAEKILEKLHNLNMDITFEDIYAAIEGIPTTIVRTHISKALAYKGFYKSEREAYAILKHGQPAYVPLKHPQYLDAIEAIHKAGGKAILAHPKLVRDDDLVEEVARHVDGIEVYYPRHSWMDQQRYLAIARKYNLKISGGSDFHGKPGDKKHPDKLGAFTVEDEIAEKWL